MINGIINVYKERGFTSHDAVAKLRGILHQKKIGHTGTLDPDAVGVLPVCLGSGTRLCDMLTDTDKVYRASFVLGMSTDTQDTSGRILSETAVAYAGDTVSAGAAPDTELAAQAGAPAQPAAEAVDVTQDAVREHNPAADARDNKEAVCVTERIVRDCIMSFVGEYDQVPPMYSALKVDGKKLYELARAGQEVERKPRRVCIRRIQVHDIREITKEALACTDADPVVAGIPLAGEPQLFPKLLVTMTVECSKGTYIRTLCHDIGEKLGTGGCMSALERVRVGAFDMASAKRLCEIGQLVAEGRLDDFVTPVDAMFADLPGGMIREDCAKLLHNGNPFLADGLVFLPAQLQADALHGAATAMWADRLADGARVRVYDLDGTFAAIYGYDRKHRIFRVVKMFRSC